MTPAPDPLHPMTRAEYQAEIRALEDEVHNLTQRLAAAERLLDGGADHAARVMVDEREPLAAALEAADVEWDQEPAPAGTYWASLATSVLRFYETKHARVYRMWNDMLEKAEAEKAAAEAERDRVVEAHGRIMVERDRWIEINRGIMAAICEIETPVHIGYDGDELAYIQAVAEQFSALQTDLQRLRGAAVEAQIILEALAISVKWELAPEIMIAIHDTIPKLQAALTGHATGEKG